MCGIVGYFDYTQRGWSVPVDAFDVMIDAMAHRGPDGRGRLQRLGVGLGHRRLAIIDVDERAAQPMASPDEKVHLTYNGEIYNFPELRRQLEGLGHVFRTTSDTEVLLHAYLEWDLACVDRLSGIFAFGIYDARKNRLWLVRDHLGVKPLFYADVKGALLFASDVRPILLVPEFDDEADLEGVDAYFTFSYVPAPLTGYRHIRQLPPGHQMVVEDGRVRIEPYWSLPLEAPKLRGSVDALVDQFDARLKAVVKQQMVSDVPLGGFLSSGTDSFAIIRAMEAANPGQTRAFSVGFTDPRFDELPGSLQAAEALGVTLASETMTLDYSALCDRVRPHTREPFADSSSLPTYLLCQMARRQVTVALSGDGADETLGGYATHDAAAAAARYRHWPRWVRQGIVRPLTKLLPEVGGKYSLREKAGRFVAGAEQGRWRDHASWRVVFTRELKRRAYTEEFWDAARNFDPLGRYAEPMRRAERAGCGELDCLLYADQTFYLPSDMLVKVDRMSMAHSLEVRVPFLDKDLVEFCWRLPVELKRDNGLGKIVLRRAIADPYPDELARRPKSGFNMACDSRAPRTIPLANRFCRPTPLRYGQTFGRYHQLMIRYLLALLPG